jgi:methyl-accepting chemotaxis protein
MFRKFHYQLALVLLPLIATVAALGWLTFTLMSAEQRAARQAQVMQQFLRGLQELADDVHRHRNAALAVLAGDVRFDMPLAKFRKQLETQFDSLDALHASLPRPDPTLTEQWFQARDRWEFLRAYHTFRTPEENNELHARLQADLMALAAQAGSSDPPMAWGGAAYRQGWLLLAGATLGLVASLVLAAFVARRTSRQVHAVTEACGATEQGDYEKRVPVSGRDELGQMAGTVNRMLEHVQGLGKARDERDRIQVSLYRLLEDLQGIAAGDLTREATSDTGLPVALAGAVDTLVHQLRHVLGAVQTAALQASASAKHVQSLTEDLAEESDAQGRQLTLVVRTLDDLGTAEQRLTQNATVNAGVVDQTMTAVHQSAAAARLTTQAINALRTRLEATARHARNLGTHTPDVAAVVSQLDELAQWSSSLLLRGEAEVPGVNGVAAVAQRLAVRAADTARGLSSLGVLQQNLRQVGTTVEEAGREAVHSTLLAVQMGQAAAAAETAVQRVAGLNSEAVAILRQRSQATEALVRTTKELGQRVQVAARQGWQAAQAAEGLVQLADELRRAVGNFRLPADQEGFSSVLSLDGQATAIGSWVAQDSDSDPHLVQGNGSDTTGVEALSEK